MNLDNLFGVHAQSALLRAYRTEVIANNIANAETPGYKARDLDFKSLLNSLEATSSGNSSAKTPAQPLTTNKLQIVG